MQSLLKWKVREKEHSRCETIIVKGSSAALRWFQKATVARNLVREKFYETYRSRNRQYFPQTGNCAPVTDAHRALHFAICYSYSTSRRSIFRWLLLREN
jgi:hypothetical protein